MSRAPNLSRALTLETPQITPDGAGGFVTEWHTLGTLWAEIRASTGRERQTELGPQGAQRLRVLVRAAPQGAPQRPRPDQRFREGARIFRILSVTEADAQGRYLLCLTQEESPA